MILYRTNSYGKVVSIMVTNVFTDRIESAPPCHEIVKARRVVSCSEHMTYWVLYILFDGKFHDVSRYNIYEEHMRKFYLHHCYNVKDRKVILC